MRAATLLALMGVSRPIYHLIILNEAILIVLSNHINIMLLPASHVTYTVYNFTDLINNSVCLSVCLSVPLVPMTCFQVRSQHIVTLCCQFQYGHEVASVTKRFCYTILSVTYILTTAQCEYITYYHDQTVISKKVLKTVTGTLEEFKTSLELGWFQIYIHRLQEQHTWNAPHVDRT